MQNKKVIKNSELNNLVYEAVVRITEEREHKGSYKGNGHHLAQEITAAVCNVIEKAINKNCPIKKKPSSKKKWYGLKTGRGDREEILLVLSNRDGPITKEEFYYHDLPINPKPTDQVVELELVTKRVIK